MQTFDEATLARRRRRIEADCAAPPLPPVLALQRGAGNQAVARAVAQRRMLARSCDPEEEAAQVADHDAHFNAVVASGQAMVDAAGAVRRPAATVPAAVVAPPPVPQGRHAPPVRYRFEADEDSVVYASDEEDTEEPTPQLAIDPGILFVWPDGKVVSLGTLLMAGIPCGDHSPASAVSSACERRRRHGLRRRGRGRDQAQAGSQLQPERAAHQAVVPREDVEVHRLPWGQPRSAGDRRRYDDEGQAARPPERNADEHVHASADVVRVHPAGRDGTRDRLHAVHHGPPAEQEVRRARG